ncbi:MAG: BMP family ABC transporter substrate-binding protein [Chloroflexota bacterium]
MKRIHQVWVIGLLIMMTAPLHAQQDDMPAAHIERICMVLNIGQMDDGTFNEVSFQGLVDIRHDYDLDEANTVYLTSSGPEDWELNISDCIDNGFDVVVTVGFQLSEATLAAAQANPGVYFIGVDHFVLEGPENYVGIQFRDDEAGFLMGYLAGLVTESGTIGGIFGPDIPVIKRFRHGYINGAALAALERVTDITVLTEYLPDFTLPEAGAATAARMIEAGADVLFGAAGLTGSGGIVHAAQQGVYVIGVDQDEYFTTFEGGELEGADYIISSALKRVNVGVYDMLAALLEGEMDAFPGGSNYILSLENGGISFANPHDADIPDAVYDRVVVVGSALAYGELSTGVAPVTGDPLPNTAAADVVALEAAQASSAEATPETSSAGG